MRIKIKDTVFDVVVAKTPEELQIGLSQTSKLAKTEGLLLQFESADNHTIRMSDMSFDLDLIFINGDQVVKMIPAKAGADDIDIQNNSTAVLEVKSEAGSGISAGTAVEILGEKNDDGSVSMMEGGVPTAGARHLLDEDGKNQMNLVGAERIFSRKVTEKLFKYAKADELKKLGKIMVDDVNKQDAQDPEYADN